MALNVTHCSVSSKNFAIAWHDEYFHMCIAKVKLNNVNNGKSSTLE